MLVLSRKTGESLMIGDRISITILSVEANGQVNIGVSAPREVLILRSELQKAATANQDAAAADAAPALLADLGSALSECGPASPAQTSDPTPDP